MPRGKRPEGIGENLHIIINAPDGDVLFRSDADKYAFISDFRKVREATGIICMSASVLDTHCHFSLERSLSVPCSEFLQQSLTRYCVKFNLRYERRGHVLRNRYHSIVMKAAHALNAFRYIILNPLKAGMISSMDRLEHYPFTILPELLGYQPARFGSIPETLSLFGDSVGEAQSTIRAWLRRGLEDPKVFRTIENLFRRKRSLASLVTEPVDIAVEFAAIVSLVCSAASVPEDVVLSGARYFGCIPLCRAAIVYLAQTSLALSLRECAGRLKLSPSTISTLRKIGESAARDLGVLVPEVPVPREFLDRLARRRILGPDGEPASSDPASSDPAS